MPERGASRKQQIPDRDFRKPISLFGAGNQFAGRIGVPFVQQPSKTSWRNLAGGCLYIAQAGSLGNLHPHDGGGHLKSSRS
jgi:hypothetical protein